MANSSSPYEKYVVRAPRREAGGTVENRQSPMMTFMSRRQVPEANYYIELGWICGIPGPNSHSSEVVHDFDEIVLHWGGDPDVPQDLGAEIIFSIGGQPIKFNTTAAVFISKGTPHGPLIRTDYRFPHVEMTMMLGTGEPPADRGASGKKTMKKKLQEKTTRFDYEQYVIRSPLRESGDFFKKGRQTPTMTYMSRPQINAAPCYIEFGWVWDVVEPSIGQMVHRKYDEIVLHVGGDPGAPEDLGADMIFGIGGDRLEFNTSYGVYIPRGIIHGPLIWKKVRKPHIEMAIMLGCGTMMEGWGDSTVV